jgi:hypothetical protein
MLSLSRLARLHATIRIPSVVSSVELIPTALVSSRNVRNMYVFSPPLLAMEPFPYLLLIAWLVM